MTFKLGSADLSMYNRIGSNCDMWSRWKHYRAQQHWFNSLLHECGGFPNFLLASTFQRFPKGSEGFKHTMLGRTGWHSLISRIVQSKSPCRVSSTSRRSVRNG